MNCIKAANYIVHLVGSFFCHNEACRNPILHKHSYFLYINHFNLVLRLKIVQQSVVLSKIEIKIGSRMRMLEFEGDETVTVTARNTCWMIPCPRCESINKEHKN